VFIPRLRLPAGPALAILDALVALWIVLFVYLGFVVADSVNDLTELTRSVSTAGRAVDDSGRALGSIDIPLVGGALDASAEQIRSAGQTVIAGGESSRGAIERLAALLGVLVAAVPILPVLTYYGPPRVGRALEVGAVRETVRAGADDPLLERFLAERAAHQLSYRELRRVSPSPWRDLEEGRYADLAAAELRRVGLRPGGAVGRRALGN